MDRTEIHTDIQKQVEIYSFFVNCVTKRSMQVPDNSRNHAPWLTNLEQNIKNRKEMRK